MSLKNLLVTFITSEEASVTHRGVLSMGSTLAVIVGVSMLVLAMTPVPAQAWPNCGCDPSDCWVQYWEHYCDPICTRMHLVCQEGNCTMWVYQCPGYEGCSCP